MIVIDVGCARYGGDYSVERLIDEFHPRILYGFDPAWKPTMYKHREGSAAYVMTSTEAAWTYDGMVGFVSDGLNGQVSDQGEKVPCIDLARFIRECPQGDEVVLKLDAEGSEYELLEHLMAQGVDELLKLAWVEWHPFVPDTAERRASIERRIRCELTEWRW